MEEKKALYAIKTSQELQSKQAFNAIVFPKKNSPLAQTQHSNISKEILLMNILNKLQWLLTCIKCPQTTLI
jgi:hypothetical protein